jgi:hypothetical protein
LINREDKMTEPVAAVSKGSEVERRKAAMDRLKSIIVGPPDTDDGSVDDTVDISEDARRRAKGKKTLKEFLEEEEQ